VKTLFPLLALLALTATAQNPKPTGTEILWDTYGIPHIYAATDEGLFYGYGYAQAQAHGDLILRLYGQSRGRGAEILGEDYAADDRYVLLNSIPDRAKTWYDAQTPPFRQLLDAFARGVNTYAAEHPGALGADVKAFLPVTGVDLVAHSMRVIHYVFVAPASGARAAALSRADDNGSNTWAIGPKRSASGRAMLLANPHLPWTDLYVYFEAQLVGPGTNAYGITRIGFPCLTMAFTDDLGYANTVNTNDGQDFYELTLRDGGYLFDGVVKPFSRKEKTLKIRQPDGSVREEVLTVKESVHGPVVAETGSRAVAMRVAGLDRPGMLQQYWDMCRAKNLAEFERILSRLQIPMFTFSYADRAGHILNLFNGAVPRRPDGDSRRWSGTVPGNTSKTLWTSYLSYAELPKSLDPPSGWLQNCNEPPWTMTFPMPNDFRKFPAYLAPPPAMSFRTQRSVRMLMEDDKISFDELIRYKHSTRLELADRILDDLAAAVAASGDAEAKAAMDVLANWDRQTNADSRGAVLFEAFAKQWTKSAGGINRLGTASPLFAKPWDVADPIRTPDGLANPGEAVSALAEAARQVKRQHGRLDVPWGEVYRFKIWGQDLPANGGPGPLGAFRVMTFGSAGRADATTPVRPFHGDTYVAAVEFSKPVRAKALIGYGNASQPGSPHRTDQLGLLQQKQLRPVWRTRAEVLKHLEKRDSLQ
jgi:acyl-homoserine-lactone acylase